MKINFINFLIITNNFLLTSCFYNKNIKNKLIITKLNNNPEKISIESLLHNIENKNIDNIYFSEDLKEVYSKSDDLLTITKSNPILSNTILDISHKYHIDSFIQDEFYPLNSIINFSSNIFNFIVIYFLLSIVYSFFINSRNNKTFPMQNMSPFLQNSKKIEVEKIKNISFSSWRGSKEVFDECIEIVSYFKNSTIYDNVGAEIPKGILLEGPPGTGKTLLAKTIASEANISFISVSASEFIELYVGAGSLKIRNLFKEARENSPCIIFIDEIDSIGKQRGNVLNTANDEREQTLNQLLAEMDGFSSNKGIVVIAATNRKDTLDSALLRPGRFDRIINIPLPDKISRLDILEYYLKNKNTDNINISILSDLTAGFSGAQIKNLINEAAINAAREKHNYISQFNVEDALEKLIVGIVKKNDNRDIEVRNRIAIHELGHAIITATFSEYFELTKVSIQSTYNGAGGFTILNEKSNIIEGGLYTKDLIQKRLTICLGGKAAENLFYGEENVSIGSTQDLKEANSLARRMIYNYGFGSADLEVFYGDLNINQVYSEDIQQKIDNEILNLINCAYSEAFNIIIKNREIFNDLIIELINNKTLSGEIIYKNIKI